MVVLAPLSSLTLPSGRAKPLVRGEVDGDPAASTSLILPSGRTEPLVRGEGEPGGVLISVDGSLRRLAFCEAMAVRPIAGEAPLSWYST